MKDSIPHTIYAVPMKTAVVPGAVCGPSPYRGCGIFGSCWWWVCSSAAELVSSSAGACIHHHSLRNPHSMCPTPGSHQTLLQGSSRWGRHITLTLEDPGWILLATPWQWLSRSNPVHPTEAQPTHPLLPTATHPHLPMNRWWRTSSKMLPRRQRGGTGPSACPPRPHRYLLTGRSKGKLLFDVFKASPALFQVFLWRTFEFHTVSSVASVSDVVCALWESVTVVPEGWRSPRWPM